MWLSRGDKYTNICLLDFIHDAAGSQVYSEARPSLRVISNKHVLIQDPSPGSKGPGSKGPDSKGPGTKDPAPGDQVNTRTYADKLRDLENLAISLSKWQIMRAALVRNGGR